MIKYSVKSGDKAVNEMARGKRDYFKTILKGMHCTKCQEDTLIDFTPVSATIHSSMVIHACCQEFKDRINQKIGR